MDDTKAPQTRGQITKEINATAFEQIRELMGSTQDGSQTAITLFQDEATKTFHVRVGKNSNRTFWGNSLRDAIQLAFDDREKRYP